MKRPISLCLQAIAAFFVSISYSNADDECLAQAWQGTLGDTKIMMEFSAEADEGLAGRYYYRTGMVDLILRKDKKRADRWQELNPKGKVTGLLTLACAKDVLSGQWQSPDGKTTLPIKAEKAASYSEPRLKALKPKVVSREAMGSRRYEIIAIPEVKSVQGVRLSGDSVGVGKVNQALFDQYVSAVDEFFTCNSLGRWRRGLDHGYEHESKSDVIAWNDDFVVIDTTTSGYCGGAHPYHGHGATTYSLQSGEPEDVSLWLVKPYREDIGLGTDLGRLLVKLYRKSQSGGEDDCLKSIEFSGAVVWPTDEGLVFQSGAPYAFSACIEDITVPYKAVAPYLSPEGATRVKSFLRR